MNATAPNRFGALQRRDLTAWVLFALVLLIAPMLFSSSFSITMLSQMGIGIVACLSFNILLGQGGMLSFGHAVYTGLASFVAIHALRAIGDGSFPLPVSLSANADPVRFAKRLRVSIPAPTVFCAAVSDRLTVTAPAALE